MNLKDCTTAELVAELMTREGIEATTVEPYEDISVIANGSAIILKIIDESIRNKNVDRNQ